MAAVGEVFQMGYLLVVDPVFTVYVQDEYGLSESFAGNTHS